MTRKIITLTTDFGLADHFVGTMKGVIKSIAPAVEIIDICHEITPFEITEGAFALSQAYPYFPKKTVHMVVVDPGVGTARRPILVEAAGQYFLGPDNGVFSMVYRREKAKVRGVTAARYFRKPLSQTFQGRDVFAPVAAHLAKGATPGSFGKRIQDYLRLDFETPTRTGKRVWTGTILKIDRFGNLITNLKLDEFPDVASRPFELQAGVERITRLARTYSEGKPGELFVIPGSAGFLEVSANQASAAKTLGCGVGAPVELTIY